MSFPSINSALASPKTNLQAVAPPTVSDDATRGYSYGSMWADTVAEVLYFCVNPSAGAAVWVDYATVAGPAGSGVTSVPFGLTTQVPFSIGEIFMAYGGVATSAAPFVATRDYRLIGASIRVNVADPTQAYSLGFRVNGALIPVETVTLPAAATKFWDASFSTSISAGDEIDAVLTRTTPSLNKSTFSRVTATLELREL